MFGSVFGSVETTFENIDQDNRNQFLENIYLFIFCLMAATPKYEYIKNMRKTSKLVAKIWSHTKLH